MNPEDENPDPEYTARLIAQDLAVVGNVTCVKRFDGWALLDDTVMFGFVSARGDLFLRTNELTAAQFVALGATKHEDMPYWNVPPAVQADLATLRDLAYEAADVAHLAHATDQSPRENEPTSNPPTPQLHMRPTRRPEDPGRR